MTTEIYVGLFRLWPKFRPFIPSSRRPLGASAWQCARQVLFIRMRIDMESSAIIMHVAKLDSSNLYH